MRTIVSQTFSSQSVLAMMNSYAVLDEKDFFKNFGWEKAKMLGTDEEGYVDSSTAYNSITSFDIGDCITIFAIEKENNKNIGVICWHIGNGSSVKNLIKEMKGYDYTNPYDIYIIGGNSSTTEGTNCLLNNIHKAINNIFNLASTVKLQLTNLDAQTGLNFVSTNLCLNGTLTLCYHNIRHL